jgi:hypothetical protein
MQLLARRFFSWYKSNKNIVILLYGISSALIAVNALLTLTFVSITLLTDKPTYILPHVGGMIPHIASGSLIDAINNTYIMTSIVAFIVTWTATAMLLRHHSHKTGAIKYWIIVSIPLGYFLSQFIDLFQAVFAPLPLDPISSLIIFTLGFTLSKPIGGILFAVAFWVIAKSIAHDNIVRSYMIISAFGFALLFVSNQAIVLVTAPYPPFGLATVSFVGLASYLVLIGIYSSASSVAQDVELRNSIRKFAISKSRFLDTIGTAHMEQEIEKNVVAIAKSHQDMMEEETGLRSSLSEDDIKEYLEMVLKEVKNSNKKDDK